MSEKRARRGTAAVGADGSLSDNQVVAKATLASRLRAVVLPHSSLDVAPATPSVVNFGYTQLVASVPTNTTLLDRMVSAVERVRERLLRATAALQAAGVPYAVVGGNAVAAWVARVDPAAVRNTQDVDLLMRRSDLEAATLALASVGFVHRHLAGIDVFLDGPDAKARDAVHLVPAGEKLQADYVMAAPDVTESENTDQFRLISLEPLVKMKLTSFLRKDQVHLMDMLEVGLIDGSWKNRMTPELADRLQELIDTPEG